MKNPIRIFLTTVLVLNLYFIFAQKPAQTQSISIAEIQQRINTNALDSLTKLIEKDKKNQELLIKRGELYETNMRLKDALQDFESVLNINSKNPKALIRRGRVRLSIIQFYKDTSYFKAIKDFESAISIDPKSTEGYNLLATSYSNFSNGKSNHMSYIGKSIDYYMKSIEINPNQPDNFYQIGNLKLDYYKDTIAALDNYNKAIKLNPTTQPWYYIVRGRLYRDKAQYKQSINDFTSALNIDSSCWTCTAYFGRGESAFSSGEYQLAINDFSKVLKFALDTSLHCWIARDFIASSYGNRGLAYYYLDKKDLACRDWSNSAEFGSKYYSDFVNKYCQNEPIYNLTYSHYITVENIKADSLNSLTKSITKNFTQLKTQSDKDKTNTEFITTFYLNYNDNTIIIEDTRGQFKLNIESVTSEPNKNNSSDDILYKCISVSDGSLWNIRLITTKDYYIAYAQSFYLNFIRIYSKEIDAK